MSNLMLYATKNDAELIRRWINVDRDVAWIVKDSQVGCHYRWRAVAELAELHEQQYAIWHTSSGPLNIPSGSVDTPDELIANPFDGWAQQLGSPKYTAPWFGGNLPGPYVFTFAEHGREAPGSIARSEFSWPANRYAVIGNPAARDAMKWWNRLRRFLHKHSTRVPWIEGPSKGPNPFVYLLPEADSRVRAGTPRDVNPWFPTNA